MMPTGLGLRGAIGVACVLAACVDRSAAAPELDEPCALAQAAAPLAGVPEASGLTLSRRTPGLLWTHNDSGQPFLFAFDASGAARGRVRVTNSTVEDWEDVTAARCPAGNCLYVADIGDNDLVRRHVTLYRLPEPAPHEKQAASVEIFTAAYPDGPHDAEALFVAGDDVYLVTKDNKTALYRFPQPLRTGGPMMLERVADLPMRRVTDADASADGSLIALRTNEEAAFYRLEELLRGGTPAMTVSLQALEEPQGEGVALDASGMLYLTSESGGGQRSGTLRALRCTLPP